MRYFILALSFIFAVNLSAQTSLQYQAHAPSGTPAQSKFSVYLADDKFDENSHLNASAFWYVENADVEVSNGIVNYTLKDIPDNILVANQSNIFVYAYVNGQTLGRLPLYRVPYALKSKFSATAEVATNAVNALSAKNAEKADTSKYATNAGSSVTATFADSARISDYSNKSGFADTARAAGKATLSDLATYSSTAAHSAKSDTAKFLVDSTVASRNVQRGAINVLALEGGETAPVGSYATRGTNGISWETNPQHKTTSVSVYTSAPASLPGSSRWVVSRVAVDYNIATVSNPSLGQLVSIYNGSTANNVTVRNLIWGTDTALDYVIGPNQSRTLWFDGTKWVVVE